MPVPISDSEMLVLIREEVAALDEITRPAWKRHHIPLQRVPVHSGIDRKEVFIVAKQGNEVVLFDDLHNKFATGNVGDDGALLRATTHGDSLASALRHFPSTKGARDGNSVEG